LELPDRVDGNYPFLRCAGPYRCPTLVAENNEMPNALTDLSNQLASLVEQSSASVVTVHGRPRLPSSGVIWRQGLVLTSDAALRRDEDIRVTLPDGNTVAASVKGRDGSTDLALIACDTGAALPVNFVQSALKPGQIILTVGRTGDTGPISTMGVISGVASEWQTWRGGKLEEFVRLDVSVYPTSAGGGVVDSEGGIIGIVSAGLSRSSVIAITRATIERVAPSLASKGRVARGYLGVGLQAVSVPNPLKQQLNLNQSSGVMILNVEENGPAARAGVVMGDVIISLAGREITGPEALHAALDPDSVGKDLLLRILRGGALKELSVAVAERPGRGA
jgi:serine protease Do